MRYTDENHFKEENGYEVAGLWYPRVTRILDIKSKPALDGFFKEMESFSAAEAVKQKSAEEGSLVHSTIQKIISGEHPEIAPEIAPAVAAFERFNETARITFHPEFIECRIWSERHRYAGTVDALAAMNGKSGVLDIKTSFGFWPEYNLQTAAYASALQEFSVKRALSLPFEIVTRWILRIDQYAPCLTCGATLREKGGRVKIRSRGRGAAACEAEAHEWGERKGEVEIKEFPFLYSDMKAFVAAKILWEWEYAWWLRRIGYSK